MYNTLYSIALGSGSISSRPDRVPGGREYRQMLSTQDTSCRPLTTCLVLSLSFFLNAFFPAHFQVYNIDKQTEVAKCATESDIVDVKFSPDGSQIVILTDDSIKVIAHVVNTHPTLITLSLTLPPSVLSLLISGVLLVESYRKVIY